MIQEEMNKLSCLVDGSIGVLLRDALVRVGLFSMKRKPSEWVMLMSDEGCDSVQRVQRLKMVAYVVHYLLNANKLINSFSDYFEQRMRIPFKKSIVASNGRGGETTLIELYRKKVSRFKHNFAHLSRSKYKITISKGENHLGGKGNQLAEVRTHQDKILRRRQKRSAKKEHLGRVFFLNYYLSNGHKFVKVRLHA